MEAGITQLAVFTIGNVRYRGQVEWFTRDEVGLCDVHPPMTLDDGSQDADAVVPRAICEIVNVGFFSVGDSEPLFGFAVEGVKWNGFDCPYLPLSSVKRLAAITQQWRDEMGDDCVETVHVGDDGRVYIDSEFGTDEVQPSQLLADYEPLYLVGAHACTWQEETDLVRLAQEFRNTIRMWAAEDSREGLLESIDEANRVYASATDFTQGCCATADVWDSNMAMLDAWEAVFNSKPDASNQSDADLWNGAWDYAKTQGFSHA